jgi:hypothetical protein
VAQKLEPRPVHGISQVFLHPGVEIIDAKYVVPLGQQPLA